MSMAEDYRHKFIAGLHNALSGHTSEDVDEAVRYVPPPFSSLNQTDDQILRAK